MRKSARGTVAVLALVLAGWVGTVAPACAQGLSHAPAGVPDRPSANLGVAGFRAFLVVFEGASPAASVTPAPGLGPTLGAVLSPAFAASTAPARGVAGAGSVRFDWNRNLGVSVADSAPVRLPAPAESGRGDTGIGALLNIGGVSVGGHWRTSTLRAVETGLAGQQNLLGFGAAYDIGAFQFGANWDRVVSEQLRAAWRDGPLTLGSRWNLGVHYDVTAAARLTLDYAQALVHSATDTAGGDATKSLDARLLWRLNPGLQLNLGYQNFRYTLQGGTTTEQQKITNTLQVQTRVNF